MRQLDLFEANDLGCRAMLAKKPSLPPSPRLRQRPTEVSDAIKIDQSPERTNVEIGDLKEVKQRIGCKGRGRDECDSIWSIAHGGEDFRRMGGTRYRRPGRPRADRRLPSRRYDAVADRCSFTRSVPPGSKRKYRR